MRAGQTNGLTTLLDDIKVLPAGWALVLGGESDGTVGSAVDYRKGDLDEDDLAESI